MGTGEHWWLFGPSPLNYLPPSTDRIHVPFASAIHYFRWHGPTYIHQRFLLRRVCATLNTANNSLPVSRTRYLCPHSSRRGIKQWKQATKLNGRPYAVGHVPRGREVEFEGLLRGSNSSTKVISLARDGPVKRDVNQFDAASSRSLASTVQPPSLPPVTSRTPRPEDISSPLLTAHRESATLRSGTPTTLSNATTNGLSGYRARSRPTRARLA